MNILKAIVTSALVLAPSFALAEEAEPKVELNLLTVEGFVKGNRHVFDADFAAEHSIAVPVPFEFIAPTSDAHLNYIQPAPGGTGIFKVFFTTLEKQVRSNLQFVPITIEQGSVDERLKALESILHQAFRASVPDIDNARINAVRNTEIGKYPAVEMFGNYDSPTDGTVIIRIVAIPDPASGNGILAIINALPKNFPMTKVEDILGTLSSRGLGTFRFRE